MKLKMHLKKQWWTQRQHVNTRSIWLHGRSEKSCGVWPGGHVIANITPIILWSDRETEKFAVPQFDHDIELLLQKGNEEYNRSGQLMNLTESVKTGILKRLASVIYDIKAYPEVSECRTVAEAIVEKFPCLRKPGTQIDRSINQSIHQSINQSMRTI